MNLLLDTHVFIWWSSDPGKLSSRVADLCRNRETGLFLSVIRIWEIQIKSQLGKLDLEFPIETIVTRHQEQNRLQILPVNLAHPLALGSLPLHHRDPFDRMFIAQAIVEKLSLASADSQFSAYPVDLIW
ncbi:twitching motility protein PilT [Capsulimonas corticalis]|uniref:Twitching motility protein PilT n=1 Tax=Capsulimonas corticalis TaxID=2219043 RepID=A0A402D4M2_9BACT|nr:type II toxin-antitoxin system VapC family toxin [Capsulimonas corticalis]BDI29246.1 twitching motility protein PilT [Capsulimonas corticalis]